MHVQTNGYCRKHATKGQAMMEQTPLALNTHTQVKKASELSFVSWMWALDTNQLTLQFQDHESSYF